MANVFYIMGVSGVGKSTIGKLLSKALEIPFFDGDDYHPEANVKKMSDGEPLNDDDRWGWLQALNQLAKTQLNATGCIIACSALKKDYRNILSKDIAKDVKWIHLSGTFELISERLQNRKDHFMPPALLKSQFDTLETPLEALELNIQLPPKTIISKIMDTLKNKSEFGLFGLGVMGKSLCRNLAQNGFKISMYNRHVEGTEENVAINFKNEHNELASALPFDNLKSFVNSLQQPRKIMLMVNAGPIVDAVIEDLIPFLSEGDVIIDGGNSHYKKTKARHDYLKSKGINFIGVGVSGGEEGALKGPSIMPGGNMDAYKQVQAFLEAIAAKDKNDLPCCAYIGKDGSGHFVKMVHNGIEYVEMQLLAEVFGILKSMGHNPDEIASILETWKASANSYLLEITIDILRKKENNDWLINKIVDKAGNKGTGNWTTIATAELGMPSTMIASSLFARYTSFYKAERVAASKLFKNDTQNEIDLELDAILNAYQFARIINHHQGFKLISQASNTYDWSLNLSTIASIWTNGCIIKSDLMEELIPILKDTDTLITNKSIANHINHLKPSASKVISVCILNSIPISCLSESINFFNGYSVANSTASIIQAQRDYFGAHTYQRTDDASGGFHHTEW
ncbi:NADP-dependent phosphogluconate dehydrogenase [uncultured Algibacter sp.]|uniref:NADP-dependent phosphogluconate dehydrogenase n=1 Tax=uncultured Algibacter sp. TaxID=298659 RepID=UPI00260C0F42|nr:NADP-dependent phosphogluconate dehydrogenase [uncultured Algibacter sp.]